MDLMKQNFWIRVSDLSDKYGISQQKLADSIGVGLPTFKNWKTRLIIPETLYVINIANYFNVSVDYLINGNDKNLLDEDLQEVLFELKKLTPEQRKPIVSIIKGQVNYWIDNS